MSDTHEDRIHCASIAAVDAAESIRILNHVTLEPGDAIPAPALHPIALELWSVLDRMPQTLEQIGDHLRRRDRDFALRHDTGEPVMATVATIVSDLGKAADAATVAAHAVNRAYEQLSHLGDPGEQRTK